MKIIISNTSSKLIVGGKDNLICPDVINDVREYLKVKKKGIRYSKRANPYASKFKYFCTPKGKFFTGFLPYVVDFIKDEYPTATLELIDERQNYIHFFDKMNYKLPTWELYDYQKDALNSCNMQYDWGYWPRGIIDAATNAGKNSIIAGIHLNLPNSKTIMLLHNQDIFKQAINFFSQMFDVGIVHKDKIELKKPFVIAMYKTLLNMAKDISTVKKQLGEFNTLIVDESHRATSTDYARLLGIIDAHQRYFVSGTPLRMDDPIKKMLAIGLTGNVLYQIKNKDLQDIGQSLPVNVLMYQNGFKFKPYSEYQTAYEKEVMFSEIRLKIMDNYISKNSDRQILINVNRIEHGNFLYENLGKKYNCVTLYGTNNDREKIIEDYKSGNYKIIITTILQEGINAAFDTLIFASGGKGEIKLLQYIGRILRTMGTANTAHIVDFFDNAEYLDKHSRKRIRLYRSEKFPIDFKYDNNRIGTPIEN